MNKVVQLYKEITTLTTQSLSQGSQTNSGSKQIAKEQIQKELKKLSRLELEEALKQSCIHHQGNVCTLLFKHN